MWTEINRKGKEVWEGGCLFGKMVSEGFIEKVTLEQRELDVRIPGEDCPKQEVVMQRLRTEWGRDVSQKKMMSRSCMVG